MVRNIFLYYGTHFERQVQLNLSPWMASRAQHPHSHIGELEHIENFTICTMSEDVDSQTSSLWKESLALEVQLSFMQGMLQASPGDRECPFTE